MRTAVAHYWTDCKRSTSPTSRMEADIATVLPTLGHVPPAIAVVPMIAGGYWCPMFLCIGTRRHAVRCCAAARAKQAGWRRRTCNGRRETGHQRTEAQATESRTRSHATTVVANAGRSLPSVQLSTLRRPAAVLAYDAQCMVHDPCCAADYAYCTPGPSVEDVQRELRPLTSEAGRGGGTRQTADDCRVNGCSALRRSPVSHIGGAW